MISPDPTSKHKTSLKDYSNPRMVFLWGFSGAGKSRMLVQLKKNNPGNTQLVDLDEKILSSTSYKDLTSLIQKEGWKKFRFLEMENIKQICTMNDNRRHIIALGAGALNEHSMELINSHGKSIWLATPFAKCLKHLNLSQDRPLVKKGKAYLEKLYRRRLPFYRQASVILDIHAQKKIETPEDLWNWTGIPKMLY